MLSTIVLVILKFNTYLGNITLILASFGYYTMLSLTDAQCESASTSFGTYNTLYMYMYIYANRNHVDLCYR